MFFGNELEDLVCQECGGVAVAAADVREHKECRCRSCGAPGLVRYLGFATSPEEDVIPPEPFFLTGRDARRYRLSAERAEEQRTEVAYAIAAGMLPAPA